MKTNPTGVKRRNQKPKAPKCPICKSVMVVRKGKSGDFWGCSKFPKCKGHRPYYEKSDKMPFLTEWDNLDFRK